VHKLVHGIAGIRDDLVEKGIPAFVAPGVYLGEVVAPLLLIVGLYTRPAALVFAFNMVVAIAVAHANQAFTLGRHGESPIELQLLYLVGGVAVGLLGPGPWSVSRDRGPLR
jgi:putative oxidoreductase